MALHERVPRARAAAGPTFFGPWWLWLIFGNDEDTIYGPKKEPTSANFWAWWKRNKLHNLSFHVLRRPVVKPVYIIPPYANGIRLAPMSEGHADWVLRFRPFFFMQPLVCMLAIDVGIIVGIATAVLFRDWQWLFVLLLLPFSLRFIGWRADTPIPGAWGGKFGKGGGKWDLGVKNIT